MSSRLVNEKIISEIKKALFRKAKELGRDVSWFKFAKRTKAGTWRFLSHKEGQWKALGEISEKLARTNKKYTTGQIADMIAEIVNGNIE